MDTVETWPGGARLQLFGCFRRVLAARASEGKKALLSWVLITVLRTGAVIIRQLALDTHNASRRVQVNLAIT